MIDAKIFVYDRKNNEFRAIDFLKDFPECNIEWNVIDVCKTRPFPEYSFEIDLKHISYAYICHWTRNELGEVQYYLPEFMNV